MKRLRSLAPAAAVIAAVLMLVLAPALAQAQVLQQVPSDALLVVKVKNLQQVSNKIAALAQQFGVAGFNPAMTDPLGALKAQSGINNGLDAGGDAALFIPNGVPFDENDPPLVMLWPVSDYKAFVANFADAQTEGEVSTFTMGTNPRPSYSAQWGKYAALTQKKELLDKKPAGGGFKPSAASAKELDTKDFALVGNFRALREHLIPALQQNREKMLADIEAGMNQGAAAPADADADADAPAAGGAGNQQIDPKFKPAVKAAANQLLTAAESFLRDCENGTYALQLSDTGIASTVLADFKPDSYIGQNVAKLKGTTDPLVTGLPAGNYLFFGGTAIDSDTVLKVLQDTVAPVEKELANAGDEGKLATQYLNALKQYIKAGKQSRFGMVAPTGQLGQDSLIQFVTVVTGDPKPVMEASRTMAKTQEQFMELIPQAGPQPKTTHQPNAKTVDGVQLDQFTTQFAPPAEGAAPDPQAEAAAKMMGMMYGPNGMTMYSGIVDNKHVVTVAGGNDELLAAAIKAAKGNDATLSKNAAVAAVAKALPPNKIAVLYIPVDQLLTTGVNYANQAGMPIQVQVPEGLPPIGVAASTDGSALRFDSYLPAQLVQSLVAAGMQAFMQAQQGAQPGGPGGL